MKHEDHGPNKRNGVASMIQIKARSTMESDYIYGNEPLDAIFKVPYKQHTKFDKEPITLSHNNNIIDANERGLAEFGETLWYKIDPTISHLIGNLMLKFTLPNITRYGYRWTNDVGHAMIDKVKIMNGDEELVEYTGTYLHAYYLLHTTAGKLNGVNHMIGHYNTHFSLHGKGRTLYIPIPFMETFKDKQYFPAMIANMKTLMISIKIRPIHDLLYIEDKNPLRCMFSINGNDGAVSIRLLTKANISFQGDRVRFRNELHYDGFHLSTRESLLFRTSAGMLLYHTIQQRTDELEPIDRTLSIRMDFHGTVSHLIVYMVPEYNVQRNLYFEYLPIHSFSIILGGQVVHKSNHMADAMSAAHYRYNAYASSIPPKHIYMIPFCLAYNQSQPTGYYNFDGSGNNTLIVNRDRFMDSRCTVHVFAVTYGTMRFDQSIISVRSS